MHQGFDNQGIGRFIIDIDGCLRATDRRCLTIEDIIALHGRLDADAVLVREVNGETIPLARNERIELNEQTVAFFRSCTGPRLFRACVSLIRFEAPPQALAA